MTGLRRELPLLAVGAVAGTGLAGLTLGYWRTGVVVVGLGILLGGVLRAVLPQAAAGLLAVRGRRLDTAVLLVLGAAVVALGIAVPAPLLLPDP